MVWILVEMLRPAVLGLVLVNLIDDSWINSMEVAIHPLRCGSAVVPRCRGLSKVRCVGEGSVLDVVWQVLESTCATTCPVWNSLLNKLVHSVPCIAGGTDYMVNCVTLGILKVHLVRVKCVTPTHCNMMVMGFMCITS
jgi:hypothetical protein